MGKKTDEGSRGEKSERAGAGGQGSTAKDATIEVNDKPVVVEERELSGAALKAAAIAQGVQIQPNFALYLDRANGTSETVGNDQLVRVHPRMSFSALAPDDNS